MTTVPPPTSLVRGGVYAGNAVLGYCVTGIDNDGHLIFEPFPVVKMCCGDGSSGGSGAIGSSGVNIVTGAPTGACTTGELAWDQSNNRLYVCEASSWVAASIGPTGGGGSGGASGTGGFIGIVDTLPTLPDENYPIGSVVFSKGDQRLYQNVGNVWTLITAVMTPDAPAAVEIVTSLPSSGVEGQWIFNSTDNKIYVYHNGAWVTAQLSYTPDSPAPVQIVTSLPSTGTEGTFVFNSTDNKFYVRVSGAWLTVQAAYTPDATQLVMIVSSLPALPNASYPVNSVVFNRANTSLYRNLGGVWTLIEQQATIAAGSITAGMIAAGAIGTDQLSANAVTADKIAASTITAAKIAAGAIGASQIAADAITSDKLAANSIVAGKVAAGAIGASQIQSSAITADKIAAGAIVVGNAQIANATITSIKIAGSELFVPAGNTVQGYVGAGTLVSVTFTTIRAGYVVFGYTGFSNGTGSGTIWLTVDGVNDIGYSVNNIGFAISKFKALAAGTHTIAAVLSSVSGGLQMGNNSIWVMSATTTGV